MIVTGVLIVWPNRYSSDGMMYVRLGRGALSVDPTTQNTNGVSLQESRSAEVVSVAEMLSSREIVERVVEVVGAAEINKPRNWMDDAQLWVESILPEKEKTAGNLTKEQYDAQVDREIAIRRVTDWMKIDIPKNGYTVEISGRGSDPMLIQKIVQATMDQYGQYHVEAHQSTGSLEFFEQQVDASRDIAVAANESLQRTRSEMGWMSVESAESTLRERLVALEVALDEAESGYAESESRANGLNEQLAKLEPWMPMEVTRGVANSAADDMRGQLYGEQLAESEAIASLRPDHPRFRLTQEKMQRNAQIVGEAKQDRELTREAVNPVRQQLESEYLLAKAKAAGLKSRCESLKESLAQAESDLKRLNNDAIELAKLKWQADIGQQNFLQHAKSLEEARIVRELDQRNMSDVSIIQDASLNLKKAGPPRAILSIVGACLGLALGLLQAIVRDTPVETPAGRSARQTPETRAAEEPKRKSDLNDSSVADADPEEVVVGAAGGASLPR